MHPMRFLKTQNVLAAVLRGGRVIMQCELRVLVSSCLLPSKASVPNEFARWVENGHNDRKVEQHAKEFERPSNAVVFDSDEAHLVDGKDAADHKRSQHKRAREWPRTELIDAVFVRRHGAREKHENSGNNRKDWHHPSNRLLLVCKIGVVGFLELVAIDAHRRNELNRNGDRRDENASERVRSLGASECRRSAVEQNLGVKHEENANKRDEKDSGSGHGCRLAEDEQRCSGAVDSEKVNGEVEPDTICHVFCRKHGCRSKNGNNTEYGADAAKNADVCRCLACCPNQRIPGRGLGCVVAVLHQHARSEVGDARENESNHPHEKVKSALELLHWGAVVSRIDDRWDVTKDVSHLFASGCVCVDCLFFLSYFTACFLLLIVSKLLPIPPSVDWLGNAVAPASSSARDEIVLRVGSHDLSCALRPFDVSATLPQSARVRADRLRLRWAAAEVEGEAEVVASLQKPCC